MILGCRKGTDRERLGLLAIIQLLELAVPLGKILNIGIFKMQPKTSPQNGGIDMYFMRLPLLTELLESVSQSVSVSNDCTDVTLSDDTLR